MITIPLIGALVRGAAELEPTDRGLRLHRLPACARAQSTDPQLAAVEAQPAGVRLTTTRATIIELDTLRTALFTRTPPDRQPSTSKPCPAVPLLDNLHPDAATHHLIGERFATLAFAPSAPFAAPVRGERS